MTEYIDQETNPKNLLLTTRFPTSDNQLRHLIRSIQYLLLIRNLARRTAIARWDVESWVPRKEIPWSQQQCHGFCRHDREVLGGREMRDAKCVPEDNVGIVDRGVAVGDPFGDASGRLA
jgi:hypothetical protein